MSDDPVPSTPAAVTPEQVRSVRAELGEKRMAALLGVGVGEVQGWEAGTLRVPSHAGAWIVHLLGAHARERAAADAGIVRCAGMSALEERRYHAAMKGRTGEVRRLEGEVERHAEACPECIRVREWLATQPALPPPPRQRGLPGVFGAFFDRVDRIPARIQAAAVCAVVFAGVTLARWVPAAVLRGPSTKVLHDAILWTLAVAMAGAAGRITWSLVRRPLRPLGRAAPYLAGMLSTGAGALVALSLPTVSGDPELSLAEPGGWAMLALVVVLGGPLVGHTLRNRDGRGDDGWATPGSE